MPEILLIIHISAISQYKLHVYKQWRTVVHVNWQLFDNLYHIFSSDDIICCKYELDSHQINEETGRPLLVWVMQPRPGSASGGGGWHVGSKIGALDSWSIPSCRWPSRRRLRKPDLPTKQTAYTGAHHKLISTYGRTRYSGNHQIRLMYWLEKIVWSMSVGFGPWSFN